MDNGTVSFSIRKKDNSSDGRCPENQSEKLLVREIQEGNVRAFKNVMRTYYRELIDFAHHYVKSSYLAKDVVQDVFANIWERRSSWSPDRSLKMYLYQSVKNEALKLLRNRKTERKYIESYLEERGEAKIYPEQMEISEEREFQEAAQQAIQSLPERARMTYQLHRRDGLTYKEIAQVMDVSHKTVESQMSRALRILRERLANYLPTLLLMTVAEYIFC
ncbi:RNA polymerase sigma factor [Halalkalibaculum sp. DA3122]|uniref:RNA polymerase sigma factor n=1 Tax=unclassified Halalkalibaculum TaxID=2964617 RepID=UPI003754DB49